MNTVIIALFIPTEDEKILEVFEGGWRDWREKNRGGTHWVGGMKKLLKA
jgi:hypothetical protein